MKVKLVNDKVGRSGKKEGGNTKVNPPPPMLLKKGEVYEATDGALPGTFNINNRLYRKDRFEVI